MLTGCINARKHIAYSHSVLQLKYKLLESIFVQLPFISISIASTEIAPKTETLFCKLYLVYGRVYAGEKEGAIVEKEMYLCYKKEMKFFFSVHKKKP